MLWIDISLSLVTLYSVFLIYYNKLYKGLLLAIPCEFAWIALWFYTDREGIILLSTGIVMLSIKRFGEVATERRGEKIQ